MCCLLMIYYSYSFSYCVSSFSFVYVSSLFLFIVIRFIFSCWLLFMLLSVLRVVVLLCLRDRRSAILVRVNHVCLSCRVDSRVFHILFLFILCDVVSRVSYCVSSVHFMCYLSY